jgi:hypothetical protein
MRNLLLVSILALAGVAQAQTCGTLAITGAGTAGTQLDVALTGATARGFAFVVVGETTGTTTVQLPGGGSFTLGLDTPFIPVPFGRTDTTGAVSRSITVPSFLTTQYNVNAQALTFSVAFMPFAINACTSNVVAFTVGG